MCVAGVTACVYLCCCCKSKCIFQCCGWAMAIEQLFAGIFAVLFATSLNKIYEELEEECFDCGAANVGGVVYIGITCSFAAIPAGIWMVISTIRSQRIEEQIEAARQAAIEAEAERLNQEKLAQEEEARKQKVISDAQVTTATFSDCRTMLSSLASSQAPAF